MSVLFPNSPGRVHLQDFPFRAVGKKNMDFELVKKAKRTFSDTGNRTRALPALYSELTLRMRAANPSH